MSLAPTTDAAATGRYLAGATALVALGANASDQSQTSVTLRDTRV
jgi:hypothetical protein